MKNQIFALGAIVCLCFCSSAKTSTFPVKLPLKSYAAYCQKAFDITISTPKGFADMEKTGAYSPFSKNGNIAPTCVMGAFAKSNDSQCVVMFGDLRFPVSKEEITSGTLSEKAANFLTWATSASGYNICRQQSVNLNDCATFLPANKFNADSAITVSMPTNGETIDGTNYTTCTQLLLKKAGRPVIEVSILFTDKGVANKQQYLDSIFKAVKFGNAANWIYDKATDKAASEKYLKPWNNKLSIAK